MKNKLLAWLFLATFTPHAVLADTNSAAITAATMKALPNCLHYRVLGTCYWQYYGVTNTTLYVEHYLPDVVVSVYNTPDSDAWTEMKLGLDKASAVAESQIVSSLSSFDASSGQHSFGDQHEQNVFFKQADVVGNPAVSLLSDYGILLPSTATPLMPYYESMLDAAMWRGFPQVPTVLAEEAYGLIALFNHHIGTGLTNWGTIYPHEGKVATSNDAKAGAVVAQRAGDLITASDNTHIVGHVYQELSNRCGQECNASPVQENSDKTQYQQVFPVTETTCDYFGKTNSYGEDSEQKTNGSYVWVIWRYYKGCPDGIGKYIGKTVIN